MPSRKYPYMIRKKVRGKWIIKEFDRSDVPLGYINGQPISNIVTGNNIFASHNEDRY
jgi:hypothetical protein